MPGLIFGALGGAGDAMVKFGLEQQRAFNDRDMEMLRNENATNRAIALEKAKIELANQQRTARVGRVGAEQAGLIQQTLDRKYAGSDAAVAAANAGQTDAPLTPEQQSVIDQSKRADRTALSSDPDIRAQAALNTGDLSEHDAIALKKSDQQNELANKRLDQQQAFNEAQANIRNRLADIAEARANRTEKRAGEQMDKAELQSTRMALTSVLKDIGTQEDKIQVKLLDPMLDDKQKAVLQTQFTALDKDRKEARNHLLSLSGIKPSEQEPAPVKGVATVDNILNYAKRAKITPQQALEEAQRSGYDISGVTLPTEKPVETPQEKQGGLIQSGGFNEAGYTDVQGTIDGARRGDAKAMELLPKLIGRGMTTPAQRKQIDAILKQ